MLNKAKQLWAKLWLSWVVWEQQQAYDRWDEYDCGREMYQYLAGDRLDLADERVRRALDYCALVDLHYYSE